MARWLVLLLIGLVSISAACDHGDPASAEDTPVPEAPPVAGSEGPDEAPAAPAVPRRPVRGSLDEAVAKLEKTPAAALALVRENVTWIPYRGVVRGPEGTWADGAGNAADIADLLSSVLSRVGIRSRIAYGRLTEDEISARLESVLGARDLPAEVREALPDAEGAKALTDPKLRALARDHAWVQVQKDGAWTDLDPGPGPAEPRRALRTRRGVTPNERRKLRVEVLVKRAGQAKARRLLHVDQPVADLVGRRVVFVSPGIDREKKDRRLPAEKLRPTLVLGDRAVSTRATYGGIPVDGAKNPGGRLGGVFGRPGVAGDAPKETKVEEISLSFTLTGGGLPARTAHRYVYVAGKDGLDRLGDVAVYAVGFGSPAGLAPSIEAKDEDAGKDALLEAGLTASANAARALLGTSDRLLRELDVAYGVVSVYADARVVGVAVDEDGGAFSTDLVFDTVTTHPRDGAPLSALTAHAAVRGRLEGDVEGSVLVSATPLTDVVTVTDVFVAADAKDVAFVGLGPKIEDPLDKVDHPALAERIMAERIASGHLLVTTKTPVICADGKPHTAWYEVDGKTGEWRAVLGDGRHGTYAEVRAAKAQMNIATAYVGAFKSGWGSAMLGYAGKVMEMISSDPEQDWSEVREAAIANAGGSDRLGEIIGKILGQLQLASLDTPEVADEVEQAGKKGAQHGQKAGVWYLTHCMPR